MAHTDRSYSAIVAANGTAVVTIRPEDGINTWRVTQISAENPGAPAGSTCEIRKNGSFISALIPTGDAAGDDPAVILQPSDSLTVTWTLCTPGQVCKVFAFYDDGRPA